MQPAVSGDERPGKFERDFDVLDEDLGSGEFGRVLKVRRKVDEDDFGSVNAKDDNVYAIKKSKPIEGVKHGYVLLFNRRCDTWG
jgi:hypothetical protein